jgi:hypothetical protein
MAEIIIFVGEKDKFMPRSRARGTHKNRASRGIEGNRREETITRFAVAALATLGIVLATGAHAQVTSCSGVLSGTTVHRNLVVPNGATCVLHDLTVVGNILIGTNAILELGADTKIGGNILADSCNNVEEVGLTGVTPTPIFIGGNVEINNCTIGGDLGSSPGSGFPSFTVRGNLSCENNGTFCLLNGAEIGGNVRFINNGISQVFNATIGGNLSVSDNSSTASGGNEVAVAASNTVGGNVQVNNNSGTGNEAVLVGSNVIGGNLRCVNNSPGVSGSPNTVNGKKLGQCSGL